MLSFAVYCRRLVSAGLLCVVLPAVGGTETARAEEPLQLIPQEAGVVVRLKAPATTLNDVADFVDTVQPGFGGMVRSQSGTLGILLSNPGLQGVDQRRDWYLALFLEPHSEPQRLFLIPATDPAALQKAMEGDNTCAIIDDWVAWSEQPGLVDQLKACHSGELPGLAAQITDEQKQQLESGHLTSLVNGRVLTETFAAELAEAEEQLDNVIDMIASQAATSSAGQDLDFVWDMYRDMGRAFLQAVEDSETVVSSVTVADGSLQIDNQHYFRSGSVSSDFVGTQPAGAVDLLDTLPAEQTVYWAMHADMAPLFEWSRDLIAKMIQEEKARERMTAALDLAIDAKIDQMAGAGHLADVEEAAFRYYSVMDVEPAQTFRDMLATWGNDLQYTVGGMTQRFEIENDVATVNGYPVDRFRFQQEIPEQLDPTGIQKKMQTTLYGPEGLTQLMAWGDNRVWQILGGDEQELQQLVSSSASAQQPMAIRQQLPEQTNLLMLVDLADSAVSMVRLMAPVYEQFGVPLKFDFLDELSLPRSYMGMSVATGQDQLQTRVVIPAESIQSMVQLGMAFQQAVQAGR